MSRSIRGQKGGDASLSFKGRHSQLWGARKTAGLLVWHLDLWPPHPKVRMPVAKSIIISVTLSLNENRIQVFTSKSEGSLCCFSCTFSRSFCRSSSRQSISVTGNACCCVSSLMLTTKSTSEVSSKQPSCCWPDPLTIMTSKAIWTSGLPRDCSIFLRYQGGKKKKPHQTKRSSQCYALDPPGLLL